jgi:hypothetical protein
MNDDGSVRAGEEMSLRMAYLGPVGTYGHQVCASIPTAEAPMFPCPAHICRRRNNSSAVSRDLQMRSCLSHVRRYLVRLHKLSLRKANHSSNPEIYLHPADYLVMPLQNVIQGGVIETLDSLLSPLAGPSRLSQLKPPMIVADLDLPIRHSLVARRGTKLEAIRWVRSHEQVSSALFSDEYGAVTSTGVGSIIGIPGGKATSGETGPLGVHSRRGNVTTGRDARV